MEFFDKEAQTYDDWYDTKMGKFVDQVETNCAFSLFKAEKGAKVLDIGCGTGNFSIKLAKMGLKVTAIDISDEMLEVASKKAVNEGLEIEFKKMDIYNLEFEQNSYDAVFSMAAFEFIREPERAFEEIFRVAKKGGNILIGTINKDSLWGELYMSDKFQKNTVFKFAHFKTIDDLKNIKPEHVKATGECLFIPPTANEDDFNIENETCMFKKERGGFICVLWEK